MSTAIGLWVALMLAAPPTAAAPARLATMRPINLNLLNLLNLPPAPAVAPAPRPAWSNFQTPLPKPPPAPGWVRALFGDPNRPTTGTSPRTSGHGVHGFPGRFAGGGRGRAGACHGGGHR